MLTQAYRTMLHMLTMYLFIHEALPLLVGGPVGVACGLR